MVKGSIPPIIKIFTNLRIYFDLNLKHLSIFMLLLTKKTRKSKLAPGSWKYTPLNLQVVMKMGPQTPQGFPNITIKEYMFFFLKKIQIYRL